MADDPDRLFDELNNDDSLTEEKLQQKLNEYHEAFRQEFETAVENNGPENVEEYAQDFFKKHVPMAAAQITFLAGNSDSDTVRANCSKYIIEAAFANAVAAGDPIKDLLSKLTKNDKEPVK